MVFNTTFNNISAISWQSVLLMEETRVLGEKPLIRRKSLSNFIINGVSSKAYLSGDDLGRLVD